MHVWRKGKERSREREGERLKDRERERQRERDRERIPTRRCIVCAEPNEGLEP